LAFRPLIGRALLKNPGKKVMIAGTLLFALTSIAYFLLKKGDVRAEIA
jgi:hypothetical protein